MIKGKFCLLVYGLVLLSCAITAQAQESIEHTVRIRTRVVFIDALVTDKKTSMTLTGLTRSNFEVLADLLVIRQVEVKDSLSTLEDCVEGEIAN